MRYLFFHTNRKGGRFGPTWDFVEKTQARYGWERIDTDLFDKKGYSKAINRIWDKGDDLLWLEEDKIPTVEIIDALAACEESDVCSQLYTYSRYDMDRNCWLPPVLGGVYKEFTNHLGYVDKRPLHEGEVWGEWLDLGLLKVSKAAQKHDLAGNIDFGNDHMRLGGAFYDAGIKIHAHRPVIQHNHVKAIWGYLGDYSVPGNPEEYLDAELENVRKNYGAPG
jgi:hypothetical protein